MAMQDDDAPFKVFRMGYTAFAWTSLGVAVLLTVAVMRTLFVTTPDGTATSRAMARVAPTLTALVAGQATRDPNAIDPAIVKDKMAICAGCHTLDELGFTNETCPDLSTIASVAAERLASADYSGTATDIEAYLHESIVNPSVFVVPAPAGKSYGTEGQSVMPVNGGAALTDADVQLIVKYLASLK